MGRPKFAPSTGRQFIAYAPARCVPEQLLHAPSNLRVFVMFCFVFVLGVRVVCG